MGIVAEQSSFIQKNIILRLAECVAGDYSNFKGEL